MGETILTSLGTSNGPLSKTPNSIPTVVFFETAPTGILMVIPCCCKVMVRPLPLHRNLDIGLTKGNSSTVSKFPSVAVSKVGAIYNKTKMSVTTIFETEKILLKVEIVYYITRNFCAYNTVLEWVIVTLLSEV